MNVLCLLTEFRWWPQARSFPYSVHLALEEALRGRAARVLTVPTPWLPRLRELCGDRRFDQVWVEVVHQKGLDDGILEWAADRAPVRVGFVPESLEYDEVALAENSAYRARKASVERRLKLLTHAVMVDEHDVREVNAGGHTPALWWPQAVPAAYLRDEPPPAVDRAIFVGSVYGPRKAWLEDPALRAVLVALPSPEAGTPYPRLFDRLQIMADGWQRRGLAPRRGLALYLALLRPLRRRLFARWLAALGSGAIVVNLPHTVRSYPGRVVEAMAVSRPVVTWEIPDRPRTQSLFEAGREILTFREAAELAETVLTLKRDPARRRALAAAALRAVARFHTTETRVAQILDWLATGDEPRYR